MSKVNKNNKERSSKRAKSKIMEVDDDQMEFDPSLVSAEIEEDFDEKYEMTCQIKNEKMESSKVESHFLNEQCTAVAYKEAKVEKNEIKRERKWLARSQKIEIINLRDDGWRFSKIAKFYDMAESSVRTIIKRREQIEDQKESKAERKTEIKRKWLALSQKIEIINRRDDGWRFSKIAKFYDMAESSVRTIIKRREQIEAQMLSGQTENTSFYIKNVEKNVKSHFLNEKTIANAGTEEVKLENIERQPTLSEKLEILKRLEQGWKISKIANHYDLKESSIKFVLKTKKYINFQDSLLKQQQNITLGPAKKKLSDELEEMEIQLHDWIKNFDKPLTANEIKSKAVILYNDILKKTQNKENGKVEKLFTAKRSWFLRFKKRTRLNCKGERKILTLSQKIEIISKSDEGWRSSKIAKFYDVAESSIRTIIKQREQLEEQMVTAIGKKCAFKL